MMRIRIVPVGFMHKTANWWSCMRRGEVLGLRCQDLRDMERTGKIHIRQQYARGRDDNGVKRLRLKPLKNDDAGWREIKIDPVLVDLLRAHLQAQEFERRRDDYQDDDLGTRPGSGPGMALPAQERLL